MRSTVKWFGFIIITASCALVGVLVGSGNALTLVSHTIAVEDHRIQLQIPEGMKLEFLAALDAPRFLIWGPGQELIIGSRHSNVYRLKRPYTTAETLVSLNGRNHSVAYRDGLLFVAESGGLHAAPYSGPDTELDAGDFRRLVPLPSETGGHWSRTVIIGADARIYVGIGISGNCSDEYLSDSYPFERRRGGVFVVDETTTPHILQPYAAGLRNPIGLAAEPTTGTIYATNAGPDNLGYDQPPEVLAALGQDSFHGMPWFQYIDGRFQSGQCATGTPPRPLTAAKPPSALFEARSTPQGIAFIKDNRMGAALKGSALVAIHGSWAVAPDGGAESRRPPKIVMVRFKNGRPVGVEDFVTGFQRHDGSRFARPSGMLMGRDGQLYFTSDDGEVMGLFRLGRPIGRLPNLAPIYDLLSQPELRR